MPPLKESSRPRLKMPWWRAAVGYTVAVICDFLKFVFNILVFTAPVLIGYAAGAYAQSSSWLSWVPTPWVQWGVTAAAGAAEAGFPPIALTVEMFGVVMAMAVGFIGGLFLTVWFFGSNSKTFSRANSLKKITLWGASVMPIANFLPTLTTKAWVTVHAAKAEDREALKKWRDAQAAAQQEQRERAAALMAAGNSAEAGPRTIPETLPLAA